MLQHFSDILKGNYRLLEKESPVYHIKQSFGNFINVVCTFIRCNKKITGMKKKINWNRVKPIIQQQHKYSLKPADPHSNLYALV